MPDRVLLKLGGSVLTKKDREGVADRQCIARIAREISRHTRRRICIVHGAGSFGHPEAHRYGLAQPEKGRDVAEGVARTHGAVCALNAILVGALNEAGTNAVGIHPLGSAVARNGRLVALEVRPVRALMEMGVVPVVHGDVVVDEAAGVSIVSGDQIVRVLAEEIPFSRVGLATDVPGVLDASGNVIAEIGPSDSPGIAAGGSLHTDVTGGMRGKLKEMLALAEKGIGSEIFHVSRLGDFMEGRPHGGTRIRGSTTDGQANG
ncbi:MAG: isopentenyl phosphate kinase [Methanolinea sp.]|nr:isopentenyl phosphate kinase [Methanolinea sp.]